MEGVWKEGPHLWCLGLDFSGASEGAVDFTHGCGLGSC